MMPQIEFFYHFVARVLCVDFVNQSPQIFFDFTVVISLITEKGVLGLGRSAVVFAPRSFGSTDYEALYGSDFM